MSQDIVLITGGDGNIAKRIVKTYLDNGCRVIATDLNKITSNPEFYENKNYEYYQLDVTNIEQIEQLCKKIKEKYGTITHLISAAGGPMQSEIEGIHTVTIEELNKSIQLNLTSHIYLTKTFLPLLEKNTAYNKSIILISSINALKSFNLPIYSAAKSGLYGFMCSLVKELGKNNIRINVVSPGTVPTDADLASEGDFYNYRYKSMLALKDFTAAQDIADTVFSLTHVMKAVTGQNIVVDSGQTL